MNTILKFYNHCKVKWGIKSFWDFILINIVFSLAGMAIVFVRKPIFTFIGVTETTPFWMKVLIYIPLVIPIYQINLLFFGFLLGQFPFFYNKQKQMFLFIRQKFN